MVTPSASVAVAALPYGAVMSGSGLDFVGVVVLSTFGSLIVTLVIVPLLLAKYRRQ